MTTSNESTPGWDDLLTDASGYGTTLEKDALKRIESAADNIMLAVLDGMAAMGDIQWQAASNEDWGVDQATIHRLGSFQTTLAELVQSLRCIESNAIFGRHQLELADARTSAAAAETLQ